MAKFNVYILASHRSKLIEIQSYFLKRVQNKSQLKVWFMTTGHGECGDCEDIYKKHALELNEAGVDTEINITTGPDNYMQKIRFAQQQESEYSVKMDEDLWFNENVWDFMIEHADCVLERPENLVLSPILSNGIPTCDLFCEDFFTDSEYNEVKKEILSTRIPNLWGANYTHLNDHTVAANIWRPDLYYQGVRNIKHHYKGIHPVRCNFAVNKKINDLVLANFEKICSVPKEILRAENNDSPYFCNSIFVIKTATWRKIINDPSLYVDPFDEVPLNKYRDRHGLRLNFIRNGYCFHTLYNTVGQASYENELHDQCVELVRGR